MWSEAVSLENQEAITIAKDRSIIGFTVLAAQQSCIVRRDQTSCQIFS